MKKLILMFGTMLLFTGSLSAQLGVNLTLAFPQGEFKNNVDRIGFGGSGEISFSPIPLAPYAFGLNVSFVNYGNETRRVPLSTTIPDLTVDVNRSNNIIGGQAFLRLLVPTGPFRPYVDILGGVNYLYTQTTLTERFSGDEKITDTNISDWAFTYGAGAGMMFLLSAENELFLDLKVRYLKGTAAEYLSEGDVQIVNGNVVYNTRKSQTDLVTVHIGIQLGTNLFNR